MNNRIIISFLIREARMCRAVARHWKRRGDSRLQIHYVVRALKFMTAARMVKRTYR